MLMDHNLQHLMPGFLRDSMSALDFGWCGFERIWEIREGHGYIQRLKWLEPEITAILLDAHGNFCGLRQDNVDLPAANSMCVTVRDARTSPAHFHGSSRLERVRERWCKMGRSMGFRQRIYDAYVGNVHSPHWFALAIQPVLHGLESSLNDLLARLIAFNLGDSPHKWARISFERETDDRATSNHPSK
jgi:hypothetical protein